jgi:ribosomal protein L29
MAKNKSELTELSVEDLKARSVERRRELFAMRSDRATRKTVEKTHLFRVKRREIARIETVLTQKQAAG